jgi:hypothetical protein
MSNEILGDPRKALEEAFFARENAKLRQQLRDLDNTKRKKEALAAASASPTMPCSRSWPR